MSRIGMKLKVLTGEYEGKIGEVIEVNDNTYDEHGNFQQPFQILKFDNGMKEKFPLYHVKLLEIV